MITQTDKNPILLQLATPIAWRSDERIAQKLMGFAQTEQGSALDMFRAAELQSEPRLRRLFFRHGLDEARHARMFREAAQALVGRCETRSWEVQRGKPEDLYRRWGLLRFVAFIWLSESRAKRQFDILAEHFADHPQLGRLFATIAKDEQFHMAYSRHLLDTWSTNGQHEEVKKAIRSIRLSQGWMAWRRAGRQIGDVLAHGLMKLVFFTVVPVFALIGRRLDPPSTGWQARSDEGPASLEDMRRQF